MKTDKANDAVKFKSVVGTTLRYGTPKSSAGYGIKSTGTRSIKFINNTQENIVSAIGAINEFLAVLNVLLTVSLIKSINSSTNN